MGDSKVESNVNSDFLEQLKLLTSGHLYRYKIKKIKSFLLEELSDEASALKEDYRQVVNLFRIFDQHWQNDIHNLTSLNSITVEVDLLQNKKKFLENRLKQAADAQIYFVENTELSSYATRIIDKANKKLLRINDKKLENISKNLFNMKLSYLEAPVSVPTPSSPSPLAVTPTSPINFFSRRIRTDAKILPTASTPTISKASINPSGLASALRPDTGLSKKTPFKSNS